MAGPLDIDISTVSVGHVLDHRDRILLTNVDDHIGATLFGDVQLVLRHIECDNGFRILGFGTGDHAQTDRSAASNHDEIFEFDLGPLYGMQSTRERLSEGGVCGWQLRRHLVHQSVFVVDHVLRHAARRTTLEAEYVMRGAHPIFAVHAVATLPTRHNLFGDDPIANGNSPAVSRHIIKLNDFSDELVARNDFGFGPGCTVGVPPELRRTVVTLQVAGADAGRLDLDQRFTWPRRRDRDLL